MRLVSWPVKALCLLLVPSSAHAVDTLDGFPVDASAPVGDGPYSTHVPAWQNTGVFLNVDDAFSLEAQGTAFESPASPGRTPNGDGGGCGTCLAPVPGSRYALVGKIGEELGDEFVVGSSFSGVAQQSGMLYLGFNDSNYFDNSGSFIVNSVPEPPSTWLPIGAMMALSALHTQRRRRSQGPTG